MNLSEQLAIQAMYEAQIKGRPNALQEKEEAQAQAETVAVKRRGRPRKGAM